MQAAAEVLQAEGFCPPRHAEAQGGLAKCLGTKAARRPAWLVTLTKSLDVESSSQMGIFEFHEQKYF